jgi:hypothetical protein
MICKFFDVLFGFRCCEIRSSDLFPNLPLLKYEIISVSFLCFSFSGDAQERGVQLQGGFS